MSIRIRVFMLAVGSALPAFAADGPTPQQVFEKRLLPIFQSPNPSSCVQCHLAGVDLKNYILPSHEKTFVSLRDQGLIDLDKPDDSKILRLIKMGDSAGYKGAELISQKARDAEYAAFREWVRASAADPKLRAAPKAGADGLAKPARPAEVIRHARADRLLESFERNIWSLRFRCMSCHNEGAAEGRKHVQNYGERVGWFKKAGPEATMNYLLRETKLIDAKAPEKSLLLLKPLKAVEHGGGKKIEVGDQGYKQIRSWLEDYAKVVNDGYPTTDALPKTRGPDQFATQVWLKVENTPPAWGDKVMTAYVYAWDPAGKAWQAEPMAVTDRRVSGKGRVWQHTLNLLAAPGSERAKTWRGQRPVPSAGKYLVKFYVDSTGKLAGDWTAVLGESDFAGQAEIDARLREGYGAMTVIDGGRVK